MDEYLITFKSTTAALRAMQAIEDAKLEESVKNTAEVVPVPFSLAATCFGVGVQCNATEKGIKELFSCLKERQIDYKNFWKKGNEYAQCNQIILSA